MAPVEHGLYMCVWGFGNLENAFHKLAILNSLKLLEFLKNNWLKLDSYIMNFTN